LISVIYILNGPNLNLLGQREPEVYGTQSFEEYLEELRSAFPFIHIHYFQSNHEGFLIDKLHEIGFDDETGIVLNAGGLSHTSISLRDAVSAIAVPTVEVHISDIKTRESFRHHSYLSDVCVSHVIGKGMQGYKEAIAFLTSTP
jgi:3-dehydroquinate dehydratase-2